jgi:putative ABC transport system permease protein
VPNRTLLASLALQAVLVALVAVALASLIQMFLGPAFPLRVRVPGRAFWQLPVFAVVMALAAGAAGMRKVARSDPAQAFAGAGG